MTRGQLLDHHCTRTATRQIPRIQLLVSWTRTVGVNVSGRVGLIVEMPTVVFEHLAALGTVVQIWGKYVNIE